PPNFVPGTWLTKKHFEVLKINKSKFLLPKEEKLTAWVLKTHKYTFLWAKSENGQFQANYIDQVIFPTVKHVPWQEWNIPVLPTLMEDVIKVLHAKVATGTFKCSHTVPPLTEHILENFRSRGCYGLL
ncbi:hypothetical protein DACRYDRAFT_39024, partial [Dacryopinax primogenitus]